MPITDFAWLRAAISAWRRKREYAIMKESQREKIQDEIQWNLHGAYDAIRR